MQLIYLPIGNSYIRMSNKLQGIIQNLQMNRLDERDGEDSDNSEQSEDYYEYERKKMQMALSLLKSKQNNSILQQLKKNTTNQIEFIDKFEQQVADLHKITRDNQRNVLQDSVIKEIKQKVFNQSMMHTIHLADQELEKKKNKEQIIQKEQRSINPQFDKQRAQKNEIQNKLIQKMERVKMERQMVQMGREDQRSMRNQQEELSKFFSERFFTPEIKFPNNRNTNIKIENYAPKSTFTNLRPMANTQNNVLPRNAPELALRRLSKSKKITFASTSISQIQVKIKKINPEQEETKFEQEKQKKENQQVDKCLERYLGFLKPFLPNIESAGKNYRPKFINQFPNQNEQNFNIDNQGSSSKTFEQCLQSQNPRALKDIKLTFEHLSNLKGIEAYTNIEQAALQFNVISNINSIQSCQKIIQLNLSHNKIKNIASLKELKWLRMLNIEHNQINSIELLGGSLQILYASHNKIQEIIDLSPNLYLKRLRINNNNLHELGGLKKLHYLQQIDAHNNYIKNLKGIEQCILLRHLNISSNRLNQFYPNFTFIFLNKLIASGNSLQTFPNMFLPSLEQLYLDHNKIETQSQSLLYFPNLKVLNFDDNKLSGFCVVFSFIRFSKNLETLKYDKNEYFMDLREKVRELYEHIIYRNMNKLHILNQAPFDIGIKKYYEGVYDNYLGKKEIFKTQSTILQQIHKKINFMIKQNQGMSKMEDKKIKFSESDVFVRHKSVTKAEDLIQIVKFLSNNSQVKILHATKSLFYEHDKFQYGFRGSLHKIRGLFIGKQYRIQKRRKYFKENRNNLIQLLKYIERFVIQSKVKRAISIFHLPLERMSAQKAAIIIQKNWRCYKLRKRYLKAMAKLKKNKNDESDLQDIDLDEYDFDNMEVPEFNFELPEDLDFNQYIIRPELFEMIKKQDQLRAGKNKENNSGVHKREQKNKAGVNLLIDNYVEQNSSSFSERLEDGPSRKQKKQEQIRKIMNQWGVSREGAMAYMLKKKTKQKNKQKLAEQNMSAAQRYQRFKRR